MTIRLPQARPIYDPVDQNAVRRILESHLNATSAAPQDGKPSTNLLGLYNVKDYGAKGDGVTDDLGAIQAAVTAAGATGGTVYIPASATAYMLSGTIAVSADHVAIMGAGMGVSVLKLQANKNASLIVCSKSSGTVTVNDITIRDLTLDGGWTAGGGGQSAPFQCLAMQYVTDGLVVNVEATGSYDLGIGTGNGAVSGPTTQRVTYLHCRSHDNGGNGFDCNNAQNVRFVSCYSVGNGKRVTADGFYAGSEAGAAGLTTVIQDIEYVGCIADANDGIGFHCAAAILGGGTSATLNRISWIGCVAKNTVDTHAAGTGLGWNLGQAAGGTFNGPAVLTACLSAGNVTDTPSIAAAANRTLDMGNQWGTSSFAPAGVFEVRAAGLLRLNNGKLQLANNVGRIAAETAGGAAVDVFWPTAGNHLFWEMLAASAQFQIADSGGTVRFFFDPSNRIMAVGTNARTAAPDSVTINSTTATSLTSVSATNGSFFLIRDVSNGGTAFVLVDPIAGTTINVMGQAGSGTAYVTAAPAATQVQLSLSAGILQALGGASRNGAVLRVYQVAI